MESKFKVNDLVLVKGQYDVNQSWIVVEVPFFNNMFSYELMNSATVYLGITRHFFEEELEQFPQKEKAEKNPGCLKCKSYKRSDRRLYGICKFKYNECACNRTCPIRGEYREITWNTLKPEVSNKNCTCEFFEIKYSMFEKIKNWLKIK